MRVSRCICAVTVAFLWMSVASLANSYFVGGTIQSVGQDGKSCVIEGLDHYGNKSQGLIVPIPIPLGDADCYVLDGRLVRREIAMVQGRAIFDIQHRIHIVLSEPATRSLGQVVKVDGANLVLRTLLGQDKRETNITVEAGAQYRADGKQSTRADVLQPEKVVRIAPARPATVLAYTEKALVKELPATMSVAVQGVIKDGKLVYVGKDGTVAELPRGSRTGFSLDLGNPLGTRNPDVSPCMQTGSWAAAAGFVKRGDQRQLDQPTMEGLEGYFIVMWPDPGRVDGGVVAFDSATRKLAMKSLRADGIKDVDVTVPGDVQVFLDGTKSDLGNALKPGVQVSYYPARPQTVDSWTDTTRTSDPNPKFAAPPPESKPAPPAELPPSDVSLP